MSRFNQSFASQHPKAGVQAFSALFHNNIFWVNTLTFAGLLLLCIVYIVQVNGSMSSGYKMRELETQIQELSLKNQTLEMTSQRAQSLDHVSKSVKMLGLVDAGRPEYLSEAKPALAMAQ